jgi:hypothetical protein
LLDAGGYGRYDFRTATRLQQLAAEVRTRFGGTVASLATVTDPRVLEATLDALPGWGLTTVRIFLRELRDVWPGAQPPLDERALRGARHLKIPLPRRLSDQIDALRAVADGVQRMCGISRLRSYASAWRIAICARVRVVGGVGGSPFWGRVRRDDASARRTPFAGIVRIRCFGGHRPESVSQPCCGSLVVSQTSQIMRSAGTRAQGRRSSLFDPQPVARLAAGRRHESAVGIGGLARCDAGVSRTANVSNGPPIRVERLSTNHRRRADASC